MASQTTRTLLSLALFASGLVAQQITLPDYHHLSENPAQTGNSGSTLWWRNGPGRFQVLYEGSHFTGKGNVAGPVLISKIKFRTEDGEINLGGQVYTGVTVEIGTTTLTAASMSATFQDNRTPALPNSTTMSTLGTTTVTVAPAAGSVPNNWTIEIDVIALNLAVLYDPTGPQPNLLIDIDMPLAPANSAPLGLAGFSNTTGTTAQIRGMGNTASASAATLGTLNVLPPLVGVEFLGAGGHATIIPARNEFYGGACGGSASSFYQGFLNGQAFDLGGGLTMTPNSPSAPTLYTVTGGAPPVDLTKVNATPDATADDGIFTHALGFPFNYPGGTTSTIVASTNGFVWLDATMTNSAFAALAARLLGDPASALPTYSGARLAIFWKDLNMLRNFGLNSLCGMHVKTDTSGGAGNAVCYVTWWDVSEFNVVTGGGVQGHANWTFQMVLHEGTGIVQFRYGNVPAFATASTVTAECFSTIVGFSPGRTLAGVGPNAANPQSRDLSIEVPFSTKPEGGQGNVGQVALATPNLGGLQYGGRMYGGQTMTWNATNVPVGTILGAQLLDVGGTQPGLQFPTITAPGCMLSTTTGALLWQVFILPASTAVGTVPFVVPHGFEGSQFFAQFVALDGLFGGPDLITVSSNAIKHTVGLN